LTALAEANKLPALEDLEQGRANKETYLLFCSKFLPGVTGSGAFKAGCCRMKLTEYCSKSDEAMAFLILANNWEPWKMMIEAKKTPGAAVANRLEDCGVKQKYFKDTKGRGHSWSDDGKHYFNEMYDRIETDRENHGEEFDMYFLEYMKKESNEGKRLEKLQTKQSKPETEKIKLRNDNEPRENMNKRNTADSFASSKGCYGESVRANKKHQRGYDDESIANEQAQRIGATNVAMM
jgi:hypothetical protein